MWVVKHRAGSKEVVGCAGSWGFRGCLSSWSHCGFIIGESGGWERWGIRGRYAERSRERCRGEGTRDGDFEIRGGSMRGGRGFIGHVERVARHETGDEI
jgi:hypothetical protein